MDLAASCMVVQWLGRLHQPRFDTQTMHNFLGCFCLKNVVRLRILVEEEGGHIVYVGICYPV